MPKYLNNLAQPVYFNNTVFAPNQEIETYDTVENQAFIVGSVVETFNIVVGVNDELYIKFNDETTWTVVTLTNGVAQTAADVVLDINTTYGSIVASDEGGKVRIDAPRVNNILNAVYIATVGVGSTAAATLGLSTDDVNPISCVSLQAFKISQNAETYVIDNTNNTFIFKVNNGNWITATLTIGATQAVVDIVTDINTAYEAATADANKIASEITIDGNVYIKLLAPVYNNYQSKLYIKSTNNTALTVLGFTGNNFDPISYSCYPSLIKTSALPLYNPMISETVLSFSVASTQHYYLSGPDLCKELQIVRVGGVGGIEFIIYLEDILNTPAFTLVALETFSINLENKRISKIIIVSNGVGSLTVRELKS